MGRFCLVVMVMRQLLKIRKKFLDVKIAIGDLKAERNFVLNVGLSVSS